MSTVLLVHSGGFSSRQWRRLAERLAPSHRVLAPDLLGYREPWPPGQPFHWRQDLELLESLLGGERAHLVGHSYGGFLALKLALAHPDRALSLALYEPVAFGVIDAAEERTARADLDALELDYQPDADGVDAGFLQRFVDFWNGAGAWAALGDDAKASFRAVAWKVHQEVVSLATDATRASAYASVEAPALLLGGDRSPPVERLVLEKLAAGLPHATLRIVPGAGHMGPVTHASLVNDAIAAHVATAV